MSNENEKIMEAGDCSISKCQATFDYPFHKVNMMLFKKAVEDFVLINLPKVDIHDDGNQR